MLQPPPAEGFPPYPLSWYLFCRARDLRRGPFARELCGRRLVAFRTAEGRVAVLDAVCSHLGADLGHGTVVGEAIRCPFHHWEYDVAGHCSRIPAQAEIPAFARQAAYAAAERHGYVYVFNGRRPLFPLPFFTGEHPEAFVAGRVLRLVAECSWQMLASNNCDVQHWNTVHDRKLLGPPVCDEPFPYARRVRFDAEVVGSSIFDRLLRHFAGDRVQVTIVNWGGVFFVVSGLFRRVASRMLISVQPLQGNHRVQVDVLVLLHRRHSRLVGALVEPLSLWLRRLFTWGFMRDELEQLQGIRYSPHTLIESDREVVDFFRWAAALPREGDAVGRVGTAAEARPAPSSEPRRDLITSTRREP